MGKDRLVIALGYFDGVHLGHSALLNMVLQRAAQLDAQPAVLTFDTHPDTLLTGRATELIYSAEDRRLVIGEAYGIHREVRLHFGPETMHMPWPEFLEGLVRDHGAVHFVCGHDFRFGDKGQGTPQLLRQWAQAHGMGTDVIAAVVKDGVTISSTYIRGLLKAGQVESANAFLGHRYFLSGTVEHGYENGRKLGFPTLNQGYAPGVLIPAHGVYATQVKFDGEAHPAVTNVGVRPTFGGVSRVTVESHLLDWTGDLYGKRVRTLFCRFLRPEQTFPDLAALRAQIETDKQTARQYFTAEIQKEALSV